MGRIFSQQWALVLHKHLLAVAINFHEKMIVVACVLEHNTNVLSIQLNWDLLKAPNKIMLIEEHLEPLTS